MIGASLLLVVAMVVFGIALLRRGSRVGGIASLVAAGATVVTFAFVSGDTPGVEQRLWIAVMMAWAAGIALWALRRASESHSAVVAA